MTGPFALGCKVAPGPTASVAARLFFATRRTAQKPNEQEVLADATRLAVDELAVWSWGEGPTVLMVHGWNGRAGQLAGFVAPLVSRGYRVVAFDAPGHGESLGSRSSLPEIARAITRVGNEVGPLRGVIAHSMGGAATTLALEGGLDVERAVFLAPPSNPEVFVTFFARAIGLSSYVAAEVHDKIELAVGRSLTSLRADLIAPSMTVPLLVIHDDDDSHVPSHYGRDLAVAWPGARFVSTRGLGHQRILRDPYVNELSVDFVDSPVRVERSAA